MAMPRLHTATQRIAAHVGRNQAAGHFATPGQQHRLVGDMHCLHGKIQHQHAKDKGHHGLPEHGRGQP